MLEVNVARFPADLHLEGHELKYFIVGTLALPFAKELPTFQDKSVQYRHIWEKSGRLTIPVALQAGERIGIFVQHPNIALHQWTCSATVLLLP